MSPQTGQWADSLLTLERLYLLRLFIWAATSITVGTALFALLRVRRWQSAFLTHFAIQAMGWGVIELVLAESSRRALHLRDLASAVALDRFAWLSVGVDLGFLAVGLALLIVGWTQGRRVALVGAGTGVAMHGLALVLLDLQLATAIVR